MLLNTPSLERRVRRLLAGRPVDMRTLARRHWTLCPAESTVVAPALCVPDAVQRITALCHWREWDSENVLLYGGPVHHAASEAVLLQDVQLVGPHLYCGPARLQPGYGPERLLLRSDARCERIGRAELTTSQSGSHFFGTLLLDDLPLAMLAGEGYEPISMVTRDYEHEAGYRTLLGVPRPRCVQRARIAELVLHTDFAQNSLKEQRYRLLRARLRRALGPASAAAPVGVYLRRGPTGERRALDNEPQVEAWLARAGFDIVDTACLTAEQIARRLLDAHIVVSIEGSHLSHAIYPMHDAGLLVVLQPPDRFSLAYKEFTDRMGMRFAFAVGAGSVGGFTIALDELEQVLALAAGAGGAAAGPVHRPDPLPQAAGA